MDIKVDYMRVSVTRNWDRISTMFRFTEEIRRLIYTTNLIESVHRQFRKVAKNRSLFPTDTAALKLLYLATQNVVKKWTVRIPHWNRILAQLSVYFGERMEKIYDGDSVGIYTKLLTDPRAVTSLP